MTYVIYHICHMSYIICHVSHMSYMTYMSYVIHICHMSYDHQLINIYIIWHIYGMWYMSYVRCHTNVKKGKLFASILIKRTCNVLVPWSLCCHPVQWTEVFWCCHTCLPRPSWLYLENIIHSCLLINQIIELRLTEIFV